MPINPCTGAPGATPHWTCIAANPPGHTSPPGTHGTGGKRSLPAGRPIRLVYQSDQIRTREGYRGLRPILSLRRAINGLAQQTKGRGTNVSGLERNFPVLRVADEPGPAEVRKRVLKQLADRLDKHHAFVKGQFVAWKPGLKNRKFPDYGEPSIVTAVWSSPGFRSERDLGGKPLLPGALDDRHRKLSRGRTSRVPRRRPPLRAGRRVMRCPSPACR
jgi:hypothetical protein